MGTVSAVGSLFHSGLFSRVIVLCGTKNGVITIFCVSGRISHWNAFRDAQECHKMASLPLLHVCLCILVLKVI
jgi:hypothetical protein